MAVDVSKTLRQALAKLEMERKRIDQQIAALESALTLDGIAPRAVASRKRGRRRMSPAERRAVARRMKAYWAKRKKAGSRPRKAKAAK